MPYPQRATTTSRLTGTKQRIEGKTCSMKRFRRLYMYVCSSSSICSTVPHKTDCRIEEVSIRMYMKQRTALFFCRSKKTHDARILGDRRKAVPSGTLMAATGSSRRTAAQWRQPLGVRCANCGRNCCECVHIRCFGSPRVSAERFEAVVRRTSCHPLQ